MLDNLKAALDAKGTYEAIVDTEKGIDIIYIIENEQQSDLDAIVNNNIPEGAVIRHSSYKNNFYKVYCRKQV